MIGTFQPTGWRLWGYALASPRGRTAPLPKRSACAAMAGPCAVPALLLAPRPAPRWRGWQKGGLASSPHTSPSQAAPGVTPHRFAGAPGACRRALGHTRGSAPGQGPTAPGLGRPAPPAGPPGGQGPPPTAAWARPRCPAGARPHSDAALRARSVAGRPGPCPAAPQSGSRAVVGRSALSCTACAGARSRVGRGRPHGDAPGQARSVPHAPCGPGKHGGRHLRPGASNGDTVAVFAVLLKRLARLEKRHESSLFCRPRKKRANKSPF